MVLERIVFLLVLCCTGVPIWTQTDLYFINTDTGIERMYADGSRREVLVPASQVKPQGIALDVEKGYIYWTDWVAKKIQRAKLDGSNVEDLITSGLDLPEGIELDLQNGKMYWVDSGADKIQRANLNGSEVEDLVTFERVDLDGIVIDAIGGKMYWTEWGFNGTARGNVRRANLDGSEIQELASIPGGILKGIALDLENGKVYWTDCSNAKIQRANLNGSTRETLVSGIGVPNAMALDLFNEKMYWTDLGKRKIQRANLDGTQIEDVLTTGIEKPQDIDLIAFCNQKSGNGCTIITSATHLAAHPLKVYPNPAFDFITIDHLRPNSHLKIYDHFGRTVFQAQAAGTQMQIEVTHLPFGLYQIMVIESPKSRLVNSFIKSTRGK